MFRRVRLSVGLSEFSNVYIWCETLANSFIHSFQQTDNSKNETTIIYHLCFIRYILTKQTQIKMGNY